MTKYHLQSEKESIRRLSLLFGNSTKNFSAKLEVWEEICFGVDNWLDIGEINLHRGEGDENHEALIEIEIERALSLSVVFLRRF